jgi:multidrug efflux system outer membrane protein
MRTRLLLSTLLALGACAVGPRYERPREPTPLTWRDSTAARDTSIADLPWWQIFRDATLQQLVRTALAHNPDLRSAAARVQWAAAQLQIARGAQLPWASAYGSGSYSRAWPGGGVGSGSLSFRANAGVSWDADLFGGLRGATASARAWAQASDEDRRGVALALVAGVASAYTDLRAADQQLEIARGAVEARLPYLDLTRRRFEEGAAAELDYRQAQALYESARTLVIDLEEAIARIENALSALLGQAPGAVPRGAALAELPRLAELPPGLPSSLLERRPDVRAAERRLAATTADIGVYKAQLFPQLTLSSNGGYSWTKSWVHYAVYPSPSRDSFSWSVGASLSQWIYRGGRNRAAVRGAEAEQRQALSEYEGAVLNALREAEDALVSLRAAGERCASLDSLVVHSRAVLAVAEARYEAGTVPFLEVVDAQRSLLATEVGAVAARQGQVDVLIYLYKALGGGWQADSTAGSGAPR